MFLSLEAQREAVSRDAASVLLASVKHSMSHEWTQQVLLTLLALLVPTSTKSTHADAAPAPPLS